MRIPTLLLGLLAPVSLVGCNDMTGIWLFEIPFQEESEDACRTTIEENFTLGYAPQGGSVVGDWVHTEDYQGSGSIAFGQIETYGKDSAILVIGTTTFPGTKEGDDWIFEWTDDETTTIQDQHYEDGSADYLYAEQAQASSTTTYTFTPTEKRTADVTVEASAENTLTYYESDVWTEDLSLEIGTTGQIPSSTWLVYDDPDLDDTVAQQNEWDNRNCQSSDSLCIIAITTACDDEGSFIAYKTDYEEEDYYDHMQGAGQ